MKKTTLLAALLFFCFSNVYRLAQGDPVLTIACNSGGMDLDFCIQAAQRWESLKQEKVRVLPLPSNTNARFQAVLEILTLPVKEVDLVQIDIIWPELLRGYLLTIDESQLEEDPTIHYGNILQTYNVGGELKALPWSISIGFLFYRKDLLEKYGFKPPTTWREMENVSRKIQEAEKKAGRELYGYVFQGAPYEGLSVNALEWILSHGAFGLFSSTGDLALKNNSVKDALAMAQKWVGTISPKQVIEFTEDESLEFFISGKSVFMRNWASVWSAIEDSCQVPDDYEEFF